MNGVTSVQIDRSSAQFVFVIAAAAVGVSHPQSSKIQLISSYYIWNHVSEASLERRSACESDTKSPGFQFHAKTALRRMSRTCPAHVTLMTSLGSQCVMLPHIHFTKRKKERNARYGNSVGGPACIRAKQGATLAIP
jgi:hypothetical protein